MAMSGSSKLLRENSRDLLREEKPRDDEIKSPIDNANDDEEFVKKSIRVLLVDSDPESLRHMKNLMTQFSYQVTIYEKGDEAIVFLMKSKHVIDLVIWDLYLPKINGLKALNIIHKEVDLPIIIMCRDHKKKTVMRSIKYGACDFLVKPVSKKVMAVLWQHVYRKRMSKYGTVSVESNREKDGGLGQYTSDQKKDRYNKPRVIRTRKLHQEFEKAIEKIGGAEKAVEKLLKCMQEEVNVQGLTRTNVASHLQTHRQTLVPQEARENSSLRKAGPNTALKASKPLLNSSLNLQTRVPYCTNDQAAANAPIQYPSNNHLTMNNNHSMTNPLANLPHTDFFHQPQPQQHHQQHEYNHSSLQSPSVITKQESVYASAAMEIPDLNINPNSPELNNFDPLKRD